MQDDLTRAQNYRARANQMRESAGSETDGKRRRELIEIAAQYDHLADRLVGKHARRQTA